MTTTPISITQPGNPFVIGEIEPPLEYTFLDQAGVPINLLNYAAKVTIKEEYGAPLGPLNASVTNSAGGVVTYVWTGTEYPTPGHYLAEIWVGNGANRYCSVMLSFDVRAPLGAIPAI